MKKVIMMAAMGAIAVTFPSMVRADNRPFSADSRSTRVETRADKKDFEARGHELNSTVSRNHAETDALHGVSVETGVPEEKVRAMHKNHPKVGPAGILIACTISDETKQDPAVYIKRFEDGKNWTAQARDNHVPLEKIDARLDHLQSFIEKNGDQKPKHHRKD